MSKVVLTVDGGGTSTKVAVARVADLESGRLPAARKIQTFHIDTPFNVATLGPSEVPTVLRRIAKETGVAFRDVAFLFCGLAGIDHPEMGKLVLDHARSVKMPKSTPIIVRNDIFIGLRAEYQAGQSTGVLISGTGCNCGIEAPDGTLTKVSGTAWLLGDVGRSGSSLGLRALAWMLEEFQKMGALDTLQCRDVAKAGKRSGSTLLRLLSATAEEIYTREAGDSTTRHPPNPNFREWVDEHIYADEKLKRVPDSARVRFAGQFARPTLVAARRQDYVAIGWALDIAANLAKLFVDTSNAANECPNRVALVGGMIAPKGLIQSTFRARVRSELPKQPVFRPYDSGEELVSRALLGALSHYHDQKAAERAAAPKGTARGVLPRSTRSGGNPRLIGKHDSAG